MGDAFDDAHRLAAKTFEVCIEDCQRRRDDGSVQAAGNAAQAAGSASLRSDITAVGASSTAASAGRVAVEGCNIDAGPGATEGVGSVAVGSDCAAAEAVTAAAGADNAAVGTGKLAGFHSNSDGDDAAVAELYQSWQQEPADSCELQLDPELCLSQLELRGQEGEEGDQNEPEGQEAGVEEAERQAGNTNLLAQGPIEQSQDYTAWLAGSLLNRMEEEAQTQDGRTGTLGEHCCIMSARESVSDRWM